MANFSPEPLESGRLLSRDGLRYLVLFFLVTISLWGFVEIADEVLEGDSQAFDRSILLALRVPGNLADPLGPAWFEQTVRDITALGSSAVLSLITLVVVGFLLLERKPRIIMFLLSAIVGGVVLSLMLKAGFARPRPDFLPQTQAVYTASFPSGHSMNAAVVYLTLGVSVARAHHSRAVKFYVLGTALVITVLVGLSRLYLGLHWPTDVLAGWTAGAGWSVFCWLLLQHMQGRSMVESEAVNRS